MFNKSFFRAFRGFQFGHKGPKGNRPQRHGPTQPLRHLVTSSAYAGGIFNAIARSSTNFKLGGGALLLGGGAAVVYHNSDSENEPSNLDTDNVEWVRRLAGGDGVKEVLCPGQMLRKHPIGKIVADDDHLVSLHPLHVAILP